MSPENLAHHYIIRFLGEVGNVAQLVNLGKFQSEAKNNFYLKLVVFSCHKVAENGLKREVTYPTTCLVEERACV